MESDRINSLWYAHPSAANAYLNDQLEPALVHLLLEHRDAIRDQPVLDIGIGAGRTTQYLARLTRGYEGIDYSPAMVEHCRRRFPGLSLHHCDVRDLSRFADATFSFALFSFNGLGAVDHEGRQKALRELARVLRPGGLFVFNAHNRNYERARAGPRVEVSRNPVTLAANVVRWAMEAGRHRRMKRFEAECDDYAIINDDAMDYRLLHYYITRERQKAQLEAAGFSVPEMYDARGAPLAPQDDDRKSSSIWYVARR
jgi:SAM-dependent methyltransferase